ncbi:MAG: hypothetical protein IJK98_07445 [Clostridia bacterium]|nr:hypothetical protein [Clostridia bacterium]
MGIVLKWNFKNLFADIPRLVLTLLSVAGAFAMLTATGVTMESHMLALASINNGLSRFTVLFLQMLFYESCRITLRAVLFSAVLLLPAAWLGGLELKGVLIYENKKMTGFEWITNGDDNTVLNNIWITVKDLAVALKPYLWVVVLAVLFLFFGFVAAELLVQRRFEKEELIAVLKDDLNE